MTIYFQAEEDEFVVSSYFENRHIIDPSTVEYVPPNQYIPPHENSPPSLEFAVNTMECTGGGPSDRNHRLVYHIVDPKTLCSSDDPPLPAGSRCATQLDRPDRMARQGLRLRLRMGMKVVMWARVRTHTHTHTHTRVGYWGGCWIGSRKVGRGCGRRSGMGSGFVFVRRSTRCVRGLPRGSLSIYLSIYLSGLGRRVADRCFLCVCTRRVRRNRQNAVPAREEP